MQQIVIHIPSFYTNYAAQFAQSAQQATDGGELEFSPLGAACLRTLVGTANFLANIVQAGELADAGGLNRCVAPREEDFGGTFFRELELDEVYPGEGGR